MQTFLPYPSFIESARVLDYRRLGKQRVEALTILRGGWPNHPASRMWFGFHSYLSDYLYAMVKEWKARGYKNTIEVPLIRDSNVMPPWLGNEEFHSSHRAALLYKDFAHYRKFGWTEKPELNYKWPLGERKL